MTPNYRVTEFLKVKVDFEADRLSGSDPLEQLVSLLRGDTCRSIDLREAEAIIFRINGGGYDKSISHTLLELFDVD